MDSRKHLFDFFSPRIPFPIIQQFLMYRNLFLEIAQPPPLPLEK